MFVHKISFTATSEVYGHTVGEELIFELKKKILEEEEAEKNAKNNNNASKDGDN